MNDTPLSNLLLTKVNAIKHNAAKFATINMQCWSLAIECESLLSFLVSVNSSNKEQHY